MSVIGHEPRSRVAGSSPLLGAPTLVESDELLLARCRQGSEAAFAVLVRRHERALVRHCARLVGEASALDAAQDAFIAAWSEIRSGTDIRSLRPWLFMVARRKALAQLRERRRAPVEALPETLAGDPSAAEQVLSAATMRDTLAALAALPQAQRDAFVGVAVQGRSGRQVARQLGISELTARQLVFRARATLRSAAAACLAPPVLVARWLRRLAVPPTRLAAAARNCAAGGWERTAATAKVLRFGVLAIAGAGAVGAGALQLAHSAPHTGTGRGSPGRVASANGKRATGVLALGGAIRAGADVRKGLGPAGAWGTRRDSSALLGPSDAGGRAQRKAWQAGQPSPSGGALDQSLDGTSAPSARAADAPSDGSATSGLVRVGTGTVAALSGVDPTATVPALVRSLGDVGHAGVSALTKTLADAGGAVGSTVKQTVSTAGGAVSTLTGDVAGAPGKLTGAVAPLVGAVKTPNAGENTPGGDTPGGGLSPGAVVQTVVSGGSSASGGVSTVTQTVAGAVQATGTGVKQVLQGATGAVSALGHLP